MRSAMLFEIASILSCFRYAAARVSNATCGSSYNWMLNVYQQDPCTVAAYLARVCDADPEFVVPALGPGECYPGPSLQKSNPCRCSSVLYSLLSACAVCQSRQYLSWSTYHHNCSSVHSNFTGHIPTVTSVAAWAYQNVTKFNGFNVSVAEIDASVPASASSFGSSGQISTTPVSAANLPSNTRPVQGVENSGELYNRKIAWAVIGVVCFLSISIALAITFKLWRHQHRRPKSIAPSAAYRHRHRYAPVTLTTSQDIAGSTGSSRTPPSIIDISATPGSSSYISLSLSYETAEPASTYSPAVESSAMFSHSGHSSPESDSDETVFLSHFVRLVPQRRAGGRS